MIDINGIISSWNEGAKRLKGYEEEEALGQHLRMLFLPEDRNGRPEDEMQKALKTGKFEEEWWRMRKDGTRFWAHVILQPVFDDNNQHIGFAKITTDRTEQKRSNELNTFLMNEVAGYAIFLLDKEGKITKWSKAAECITGYTESEVMDKPLSFLYQKIADHHNSEAEIKKQLTQALEEKYETEDWKVKKDGTHFWASYVITPLHNKNGFVVMIRDLTEKRALEQETQANIALAASNKELERFAYVASHDLKEPIRKIITFSGLLKAESPQQEKLLERIINACKRVKTLIDDILDFSSIAKKDLFLKQDLNSILQNVLDSLEDAIKEKKALVKSNFLPMATVIPSQMEQLFQNLISNAIKFCCPENQAPLVNIEGVVVPKEQLETTLLNRMKYAEKYLQIKVQDNGIGFNQDYVTKIFELFQRLHGRTEYEGTGVGLSICKKIAENHGGTIEACAEAGKGAIFIVTFPYQ